MPRLILPKGFKPLLGLLVLSLCQPLGPFHLFAHCFVFAFFISQWMEKTRQYRACMGLKKKHVHDHPRIIWIYICKCKSEFCGCIYKPTSYNVPPPLSILNRHFDAFQAAGNIELYAHPIEVLQCNKYMVSQCFKLG